MVEIYSQAHKNILVKIEQHQLQPLIVVQSQIHKTGKSKTLLHPKP